MTTNDIIYVTLKIENENCDFNEDKNEDDEEEHVYRITTYEGWINCNNISKVIII